VSLLVSIRSSAQTHAFRATQFKISREREIFDWAAKTLEIFPDLKSEEQSRVEYARARLSAQIDIGRLLFPNDHVESVRVDIPEERRGLRSNVLDPLVRIYNLKPAGNQSKKDFGDLQRKFIHCVGRNFTPVVTDTSPAALAERRENKMETRQ
jgi:hypothetical protein